LLAFESAVKDDPTDPGAYVWLARIDLDNRHITEAGLLLDKANALLANFTKSEKRKNDLTAAVADGLALVAEYREDWPTAQKYLEIWLKQDPKNTKALTRMARVIFQQKTPQSSQQALEKLREAQKLDPKNVLTAEARLAMFFQQADDLDNAKKYMAAALTANPKDLPTLLYAAQFSLENGQYDDAKERATAALGIQPDPKLSEAKLQEFRDQMLSAKILRGLVARVQKDWKAAATYFEDAHLQAPGNFLASNNLALVLIEQDDKSKSKQQMALGYAQNNAQQYTNTQNAPEAASTYGRVMYKLGKLDEAAKALRQAVSASNDPDTYYFYAVVANELGNKEEARKYLKASLKSKATIFVMKQEASTLLEKINE